MRHGKTTKTKLLQKRSCGFAKTQRKLLFCISFGLSICGSFVAAEPRAIILSDASAELLEKLKQAAGTVETPAQSAYEARRRAETAAQYVTEVLRSEGYYGAEVIVGVSDAEPAQATLQVNIGPRFLISNPQVIFEGTPPDNETQTKAVAALSLLPQSPARAEDIIAAQSRALGVVLANGYADASSLEKRIIVDHADNSMHPIFKINSGILVHLGKAELQGQTRTNPAWLQNIVPWQDKADFDPTSIAELERRLLDTGVYDSVAISLGETNQETATRPVLINLTDRARTSIEAQFSYATNEGPSIEGQIGRYNSFGRADTLFGRLVIGEIEKRIETEVRLPHFLLPNQTFATALGAFQDNTKAYRETGIDFRSELTKRWNLNSFWTYGVRANVSRTREPSFLSPTNGINRDFAAFGIIGSFLIDSSDSPLNPTRGFKADAHILPTLITGDANLSFVEIAGQASYYKSFTADNRTVFAARARIGSIIGGSIPEIPSGRRLYAGGGGSVRGYEFQGIGPRYADPDSTPVGGLSLLETSFELRQQLTGKFGAVAFVDTGTLGLSANPNFDEFKVGAGIGIRYDLGFAPLRLDVGFPLNRPKGDAAFQIYIGVGQSF